MKKFETPTVIGLVTVSVVLGAIFGLGIAPLLKDMNVASTQDADMLTAGTKLNDDYLAKTYGFNINTPDNYSLFTTAEPNTIWVGMSSTPDTSKGFYVRPVDDREDRIAAIKEDATKIIQERQSFAVGNVNGHKLTVQTDDGQQITHFMVTGEAEIEVADANTTAYTAIVDTFFAAEIMN
ncbi:MAG: hypothetical protein WAZ14_04325 [Patescibacteria group bacterium]